MNAGRVGSGRRFRGTRRVWSGRVLKRVTRGQLCADSSDQSWKLIFSDKPITLHDSSENNCLRVKLCNCNCKDDVAPPVLWRCWLGGRKGIRPVKNWAVGAGVVICLERGADLHMPSWCHCHSLSLASVKSRLVLPFWYRLTRVVPERGR